MRDASRKPKLSRERIEHARKLIEEGQSRQHVADLRAGEGHLWLTCRFTRRAC
jgi:hypothetical protein